MAVENKTPLLSSRIPCLDGLRGISILLVLLGHVWHSLSFSGDGLEYLSIGSDYAQLGVRIFFVISGYLITKLLIKEWDRYGAISLRNFYARRALRIFPAFYTYIGVIIILTSLGYLSLNKSEVSTAALFLWNYKFIWVTQYQPDHWYLGHLWTLSMEEQFYLIGPMLFILLGKKRSAYVACALLLFMPINRVFHYVYFPEIRGQIYVLLHTAVDTIVIGCLAALWEEQQWIKKSLAYMESYLYPSGVAAFLFILSPFLAYRYTGSYGLPLGLSLDAFAITFLLLWSVHYSETWIGRFLKNRYLVHLGIISYSLYLWQQLFLGTDSNYWVGKFPLNIACAFILAELSYHLIEKPFLPWRRYFIKT